MRKMRQLGIRFSLDDFGSGLSSFGYLKKLAIDCIKIDGQFVRNIVDDPVNFLTVNCIGEIARSLGKTTVAEFVENEEIRHALLTMGIDYLQGYLIHKPERFEALLARYCLKNPLASG
jgi:EAL domain-containing protein (putative c-di-GMP-specific phosphodiesterase class I)